jgi:Zn-dependent protease with chaperone function
MDTTSRTPETPAGTPPAVSRGLAAYVIRPGELSPGWIMLYAGTLALHFCCAIARGTIAYPVVWLVLAILGEPTSPANDIALFVAYGPLVFSLATLVLPLGGWFWEQHTGARSPSEREQLVLDDAFASLKHADPTVRPPRRWAVLDANEYNAYVYADTMVVTRGVLESNYLEGVLAHELGHLNSSDARLTAALHRLTLPPRSRMPRGLRAITLLANGGVVVWLTRAPWGAYWRSREHHADEYAAKLGQAGNLARFLDTNALDDDLPVPYIWLTDVSHPPVEHRIDRLHHEHNPF